MGVELCLPGELVDGNRVILVAIDMGKSDVGRREHKSIKDAHFDIMVSEFGAVWDVFVCEETGGQAFRQGFTVSDPFDLETGGERKVEEDTGVLKLEMDGEFAVSLRTE